MSSEGSGPGLGAELFAKGIGQGGPAAGSPDAPAKDFDELISKLFDQFMKVVGKFVNVKSDSLLSTGALAHLDISKAGVQVNNNMLHQGVLPDARGGTVVNLLAEGMQIASVRDFSKVSPSSGGEAASSGASFSDIAGIAGGMENYRGASMGESSLGELHPNISVGQTRSAGLDGIVV